MEGAWFWKAPIMMNLVFNVLPSGKSGAEVGDVSMDSGDDADPAI